jgi:hypothetical protein
MVNRTSKALPDSADTPAKVDGSGKPSEELLDIGAAEHNAPIAPEEHKWKARSEPRLRPQTKRCGARITALEKQASEFAKALKASFGPWIKESPRAFKKRVLSLLRSHLPPYPRPGGRRRFPHITTAVKLYRDQLRQVREKTRTTVAWTAIARECVPGFDQMPYYARAVRLGALRNAVYARRKRERKARRQRRSARPHGPPSTS